MYFFKLAINILPQNLVVHCMKSLEKVIGWNEKKIAKIVSITWFYMFISWKRFLIALQFNWKFQMYLLYQKNNFVQHFKPKVTKPEISPSLLGFLVSAQSLQKLVTLKILPNWKIILLRLYFFIILVCKLIFSSSIFSHHENSTNTNNNFI